MYTIVLYEIWELSKCHYTSCFLVSFENHFKQARKNIVGAGYLRALSLILLGYTTLNNVARCVYAHASRRVTSLKHTRRDRRATDFLLCDFLLARFQALSMKSAL